MIVGGPARAAAGAGITLAGVYLATLAPGVTLWDAGEFAAAVESLGIPHPPGTPLYILAARTWRLALPGASTAYATNLFAAVCTAASFAIAAALMARWTRDALGGAAAGITAGVFCTVWLSATETEVYSAALLLSLVMIWAADRLVRHGRSPLLLPYLFALAPPLHLSALVAAPAAAVFASLDDSQRLHVRRAALLVGAAVLAAGIGTVSLPVGAAGLVAVAAAACWPDGRSLGRRAFGVAGVVGASVLGASAFAFLLLRAAHDPAINQGNPHTIIGALDVIARRQYDVPGLWPRQAPFWLQLGNLVQYADWQVALGLDQSVGPSRSRTPITLLFVGLAVIGSVTHRRIDRRSWIGLFVLFASATVGVVAYLNLKAGPSYGYGILPEDAPREARERDYFFALGFAVWGMWAGYGAVAVARVVGRSVSRDGIAWVGLPLAAAPVALNWRAADRSREPAASLPTAFARALLSAAPARAVVFVAGDNDTYPLWYVQTAERFRRDVTLVTVPLLGAEWYRAELGRRHGLYALADTANWRGLSGELGAIARHATARGRPVAASIGLPVAERRPLGEHWVLRGLVYARVDSRLGSSEAPSVDVAASDSGAATISTLLGEAPDPARVNESAERYLMALLRCPSLARAVSSRNGGAVALLASPCNFR